MKKYDNLFFDVYLCTTEHDAMESAKQRKLHRQRTLSLPDDELPQSVMAQKNITVTPSPLPQRSVSPVPGLQQRVAPDSIMYTAATIDPLVASSSTSSLVKKPHSFPLRLLSPTVPLPLPLPSARTQSPPRSVSMLIGRSLSPPQQQSLPIEAHIPEALLRSVSPSLSMSSYSTQNGTTSAELLLIASPRSPVLGALSGPLPPNRSLIPQSESSAHKPSESKKAEIVDVKAVKLQKRKQELSAELQAFEEARALHVHSVHAKHQAEQAERQQRAEQRRAARAAAEAARTGYTDSEDEGEGELEGEHAEHVRAPVQPTEVPVEGLTSIPMSIEGLDSQQQIATAQQLTMSLTMYLQAAHEDLVAR
jgi:hypothetical protein